MTLSEQHESIRWLYDKISNLPSDAPVPKGTPGYNVYTTQKDHWLGWLNPSAGTGTFQRKTTPELQARNVFNRISESLMLLWLARAAGVRKELIEQAADASASTSPRGRCKAVRRLIPWSVVENALQRKAQQNAA
jgi:hypothetical protein